MRIGSAHIQITQTWNQIKARKQTLNQPLFYEDDGDTTTIFTVEGNIVFLALLRDSVAGDAADIADFTANFQSTSNQALGRRTSGQIPLVSIGGADGGGMGVDDAIVIPEGTDGLLAMGTDYDDKARRLRTTSDGRLVVNSAVSAPPNNTAVNMGYVGDVSTVSDNFYTIPNAAQLKIQRFSLGAEEATGGNKVELFWAPNGDTTGLVLIRVGYCNGNNFESTLDWDAPLTGNGTRAILVRRTRFSGGAVEIAGFWDGYY